MNQGSCSHCRQRFYIGSKQPRRLRCPFCRVRLDPAPPQQLDDRPALPHAFMPMPSATADSCEPNRATYASIVDFIDPNYYGSGTNVLAPKTAGLKNWEGLRGKKVCLIQGAFYNKELQEKYGVDGVAFPCTAEVYTALAAGNCIAFAYDDTAIVGEMQKPEWGAYEMPLDSILFVPWGIAVKQGEKGLADMMAKTTVEWHKSGFIQELEKKWGIKPTKFAQETRDKYK